MSKLMIDMLRKDDAILKLQNEKAIQYKFVNILEYIKENHDVYIVDLAKILDTTRPTIYNYLSKSSEQLSSKIKEKIAYVYGVKTFSEVIELEKKVELATINDKPFLEYLSNTGGGPQPHEADDFKNKYEKVYRIVDLHDGRNQHVELKNVELKKQFNFKLVWKQALQERHADDLGMQTFRLQGFETPRLNKVILDIIHISSLDYAETLLRAIRKKIDGEDLKFINYIDDYGE